MGDGNGREGRRGGEGYPSRSGGISESQREDIRVACLRGGPEACAPGRRRVTRRRPG